MTETKQLLARYAETGSEPAFRELTSRYVDLVHSAALRLVNGDLHRAQDVTQTVFADLARLARSLSSDVMLGGWLHRHTCFVASKTMRAERRRVARERQAVEMNAIEDHSAANLALVAPVLDEAINQLNAEDRTAILLRFFEQQDFQSVGAALGSNEEAARKRVDRALGKLESHLKHRGVALSAVALGSTLATGAVTAAPSGLAVSISTIAIAGTVGSGVTTITILKIMSMTKLKVGIITAVVAAGVSIPWVIQHNTQTKLNAANEALRQQTERNEQLVEENARLAEKTTQPSEAVTTSNGPSLELLRLRGEVGRLRRETAEAKKPVAQGSVSALNTPITDADVNTRYYNAQALARNGDAAGALKEFLWCFDEGMLKSSSFKGVRTSFLLNSIEQLGENYPPALVALRERRDQASQRMLNGENDSTAAWDFASLNKALKEDQNTLAVFDQLPAADSRRKALAGVVYDQLVESQRYSDALLGRPYTHHISMFEILTKERPLPANTPNIDMFKQSLRNNVVNSTAKSVEALAGAGDLEHARTLAGRLLAYDSSPETKALLQQHAARAGQAGLLDGAPNP